MKTPYKGGLGPWIARLNPGTLGDDFWPVAKEISFKYIFIFKLWWPFCLAELNNLSNFGKGHYEEHSAK